jgi:DNA-binding HxlR family transcriptional regulator
MQASDSTPTIMAKQCETRPGCIKAALAILGDKWSPLLLKELAERGGLTFSVLQDSLVGISPRTLSQRLEALSQQGVIEKRSYCDHPPRYEYSLTTKGADLVSVLVAMATWGAKYTSARH